MRRASLLPISALIFLTLGCGGGGETEQPDVGSAQTPSVEVTSKLVAADAADGATDKTVSKCLTCGLGMDGSADHAATFSGYTFHLCSAHCKGNFESDPPAAILSLKTP